MGEATVGNTDVPDVPRVVAVAYSGGRDSSALLHATCAAAAPLGASVVALHVHHGLSPQADAWLAHCEAICKRRARRGEAVRFAAARITGQPQGGDSVEAWARAGRYEALARLAREQGAGIVLLAQHRRDQAETFVLQALRGGGLAGLSAMPRLARRDGLAWARPWLDVPRQAIDAYLHRHRLAHVDDASNADPRYARNRLRAQVWPALLEAFPDAETSLARAAVWAQEATCLQAGQVAQDLRLCSGDAPPGLPGEPPPPLSVPAWQQLPPARQSAVLREWLRGQLGSGAPATLVSRLLAELTPVGGRRWPAPGGQLVVRARRLVFAPASGKAAR